MEKGKSRLGEGTNKKAPAFSRVFFYCFLRVRRAIWFLLCQSEGLVNVAEIF